jgi:16S rRNA pseudouridine516 synthase
MQRLDKYLSEAGAASRRELKDLLRAGAVTVNGAVVRDGAVKIDETADRVCLHGQTVEGLRRVVLLLYKPAGFVTSTDDPRDRTVMDLLPERWRKQRVAPVGRLDKATEGLLLLTNDGVLAHRLISPKYRIEKDYYAEHEGEAGQEDTESFRAGLTLGDGTVCLPAELEPLGPGKSRVRVVEGKYHQVRRMLASRGMAVTYLRRDREGGLTLDGLASGEVRELTAAEVAALERETGMQTAGE